MPLVMIKVMDCVMCEIMQIDDRPFLSYNIPGCKELSHFYSLPFGQAEANIYYPKCHFN